MSPRNFQRLGELAVELGEATPLAANRPLALDNPQVAWFVERGAVDVFLFEDQDGEPSSNAQHVLRAETGRLAFGIGSCGQMAVVAKGTPDCVLRRLRLAEVYQFEVGEQLAGHVDAWIADFAAAVALQIEPRPRPNVLLDPREPAAALDAAAGSVISARAGGVVWAAVGEADAAYLGTEELEETGSGLFPLTADTWLTLQTPAQVTGALTGELYARGALSTALGEFHRLALGAEQVKRQLLLADEANVQTARTAHRHRDREQARLSLFGLLDTPHATSAHGGSALLAALEVVGRWEGIAFQPPARRRGNQAGDFALEEVVIASGVRCRKVRLSADERWWRGDSGAMLGFRGEDCAPVALLPGLAGRYRAIDPVSGRSERLDAAGAADIQQDAWSFYRTLPADRPVGTRDIINLAAKNMLADVGQCAAAGLLACLLLLAPAVAIGVLVDWVIPAAARNMLDQTVMVLAALAILGMALQLLRGAAMMRFEGRTTARIGAALWDRLLALPPSFFRRFTAGDLAVRMSAFQVLRDRVSGVVANALITFVFLLPMLAVLFLYDAALAWLTLSTGIVSFFVALAFGLLQIGPQRRFYAASRRLAGELLQFINGIGKLRSTGAEASAFAAWARSYREQQLAQLQIGRLNEHLVAFSAAMPAFVGAALFAAVLWQGSDELTLGTFLVVLAVAIALNASVIGLGYSFEIIASVLPGYEQLRPILTAVPDSRPMTATPAQLSGDVRFDHVSFHYAQDGPRILEDVSIHARPGEFIAIVGESGAGKSTLLRLALGLERPAAGGIYFDGRDLSHLNRRAVRRQIGVVMQDDGLQPGNLLDNIIGLGDELNIEDAWRAANLAAVAEDIAAMPMQMFTAVGDSQATFSGGQVQRIRIAAALVRNPRIVLLDEATSWLDAKSQAQVMRGIESLAATRIVIAHRLSTIRKADRIYVLQRGRVVQEGTFIQLFQTQGVFRDLVQRQMT